ncbi:MAG: DUF3213 domain-containing protein [Methanomicrobia archaeon]|nr:DUF3213 domain-containing protein [Methanomicrobia archaeon]MCK4636684.1 DUF3213 domain-containing protein [Methanomicrobia archaeon]
MLKRIDFEVEDITLEDARKIQYNLGIDISVYRVFIDPYTKKGFVVFDKEKTSEDILNKIGHGVQTKKEEEMTIDDLMKQSLNK